jgi:hypothetical protein
VAFVAGCSVLCSYLEWTQKGDRLVRQNSPSMENSVIGMSRRKSRVSAVADWFCRIVKLERNFVIFAAPSRVVLVGSSTPNRGNRVEEACPLAIWCTYVQGSPPLEQPVRLKRHDWTKVSSAINVRNEFGDRSEAGISIC